MKPLLYKEFKLAMHPICYIFIFAFPLMILIPSYPLAVGFIYVFSCYPILFLGANKGQQSNDLLFSTLLPVRKKDIVLARIFTVIIMQLVFILMMSALVPLAFLIQNKIIADGGEALNVGLPLSGYVSVISIAIIGYAIADLIFFPIYYKHGKSIVMSTLFTILGFIAFMFTLTLFVPFIPGCEGYIYALSGVPIGIQFIYLAAALVISFVIHIFVYKISAKRLENVDF